MQKITVFLLLFISSHSFSQWFDRTYTFEYFDSFITIDTASDNLWQIGPPQKELFNQAYSGSLAIITDTINYYPVSNTSIFTFLVNATDTIESYGGFGDGRFTFKHKYDTENRIAGGYVEISYDNGRTWENIIYDMTNLGPPQFTNFYSESDTLLDGTPCFQGTSTEWITSEIWWWWNAAVKSDQPEWWGWYNDTLQVRFVFRCNDGMSESHEGWMIDDLKITIDRIYGDIPLKESDKIYIFPNPASDKIHLQDIPILQSSTIKIYTVFGQIVVNDKTNHSSNLEIDITKLTPGIYFVYINSGNEKLWKKFIKN